MSLYTPLHECFAELDQHFHQVVLALWYGPGWNAALELPYEALDQQGQPLPVTRYRAMACARQLYVFSQQINDPRHPGAKQRAQALFASLNRHFYDPQDGGWFYSVDSQGAPLDTHKDLYTHAFIIFACAHYLKVSADSAVQHTLEQALATVQQRFALGDLYQAALTRDWQATDQGFLQNPLMHLTEAFLAVLEARPDPATQAALTALCEAMLKHFVEPKQGLLMEKPTTFCENWFEPGHQFEWLYLLKSSPLLRDSLLANALSQAVAFSQAQGLAASGAVQAALSAQGQLLDANQRIWAQAEYLRALCLEGNDQALLDAMTGFKTRHLHANGWNESLDGTGAVNRADLPATTAYHLATCYQALARYIEGLRSHVSKV